MRNQHKMGHVIPISSPDLPRDRHRLTMNQNRFRHEDALSLLLREIDWFVCIVICILC